MTATNDQRARTRQVVVLVISLAVSIIVGFVPTWTNVDFSIPDQTFLTILTFMTFVLLDVLYEVAKYASDMEHDVRLWQIRNQGEVELANIRANYLEIARSAHGEADLFVTHFQKEFRKLARRVEDAADKRELRVSSEYYLNDDEVFEAFLGNDKDPTLRYTWPVSPGARLFEEHAWRRYFEVIAGMAERKRIGMIRAILILDNVKTDAAPFPQLLDFYKHAERQECRIIARADYVGIATEAEIPTNFLDFGIYGNQMLFRSEQYAPEYVGTFIKERALIGTYIKFFDTLWGSVGVTKKNPSASAKAISFEQLVDQDELVQHV